MPVGVPRDRLQEGVHVGLRQEHPRLLQGRVHALHVDEALPLAVAALEAGREGGVDRRQLGFDLLYRSMQPGEDTAARIQVLALQGISKIVFRSQVEECGEEDPHKHRDGCNLALTDGRGYNLGIYLRLGLIRPVCGGERLVVVGAYPVHEVRPRLCSSLRNAG